jgi:hypothetical protein
LINTSSAAAAFGRFTPFTVIEIKGDIFTGVAVKSAVSPSATIEKKLMFAHVVGSHFIIRLIVGLFRGALLVLDQYSLDRYD